MPHRFKQPEEQQHHRRLPHVKEKLEVEEQEDEARHGGIACTAKPRAGKHLDEARKWTTSETSPTEPKYGRIESCPLPLQRAVLSSVMSQKCGPSTPVPLWKMYDNPHQNVIEPVNLNISSSRGVHSMGNGCPRVSVSARKLAASLWEMQGSPKHQLRMDKEENHDESYTELVSSDQKRDARERNRHHRGKEATSQHVNSVASHHHHNQQHEDRGLSKNHKQRKVLGKDVRRNSAVAPAPPPQVEAETGSTSCTKAFSIDERGVQPGGEGGSILSRELVKVLNQIWSLEEQHNVSTSMVTSLRAELGKTKACVQELSNEQSSYQEDIELLTKKLATEKSILQDQTEEAVLAAIKPLKEELENERKAKLKLESKYKKLSKEMNETRTTLAKTVQEFEREQKARELMEDVCDELAREIGEDKAKVEELKQQSAKYREEVEQERQMLQMAEVWREERVQMKLAEARLELEEKNAAVDKLRGELEAFLRVKRSFDGVNANGGNIVSRHDQLTPSSVHISDNQSSLTQVNMDVTAPSNALLGEKGATQADGDDSFDDDLHSIELNRRSVSGSREDPTWIHSNGFHDKMMVHAKPSTHESTQSANHGMVNQKQGDVNKVCLNVLSSQSEADVMAESEIEEVDPHLVAKGSQHGPKDWDLGERSVTWSSEGLPILWQNHREEGKVSIIRRGKGINEIVHMDSLSRNGSKNQQLGASAPSLDANGNVAVSKLNVFEFSQGPNTAAYDGDGGLPFLKQSATFPSSPRHQWAYSWSSPDPESASKASQGLRDRPQVFKDNSLKARLLEAKLEGQQEKLRNSQIH